MLDTLREKMVTEHLKTRGINNLKVLDAMRRIRRELFVPEFLRSQAYEDFPLPIGVGQTISQPYIVALMTQLLDIKPYFKILEIGTGSGYQAAVLAELCKSVYTIEVIQNLGEQASKILTSLGYKNISFRMGDGHKGWPEEAPFDAIILTAAPEELPENLINQLKEGGKMVLPVGDHYQELKLITKNKSGFEEKNIMSVQFVKMVHN